MLNSKPALATLAVSSIILGLLSACSPPSEPTSQIESVENTEQNDALVVYSSRNEHLIRPVFALFTEETGIEVEYATDKAGVLISVLKPRVKTRPLIF